MSRLAILTCAIAALGGCSNDDAGSTPAVSSAPGDEAAPAAPLAQGPAGAAWFAVDGVGLVRLHDGAFTTVVEQKYTSKTVVAAADGTIWAGGIGGVYRIQGDAVTQVGDSRTPGSVDALAVGPKGRVWAVSHQGVHHFDGTGWTVDPRAELTPDLLRDVAATPDGKVWVAATHTLHVLEGSGWKQVDLGGAVKDQPFFSSLEVSPDGELHASSNDGIIRRSGDTWEKLPIQAYLGSDRFAVGPGGRVAVVDRLDAIELFVPGSGSRNLSPGASGYRARRIGALAFDGSGRLWVSTDNGLVILGPDGKLLQQWKPGTIPAIAGSVAAMTLLAGGPALPEVGAVQKGAITGKVIRSGQPVAGADVELCESPASMFQQSPCDSASFARRVQTDATGTFTFTDIPIGTYGFAINPGKQWMVLIGAACCARMKPGSTYEVGSIPLDR